MRGTLCKRGPRAPRQSLEERLDGGDSFGGRFVIRGGSPLEGWSPSP
jgi:hypothetical protein